MRFNEHNLFLSLSEASAQKGLDELREETNLYLIAKIWQHAQSWNEEVVSKLKAPISVFVPHQHNPYNTEATEFKHEVHDTDLEAICKSQGAILLPPYGNDCSYEVGVYKMLNVIHGRGKILFPVIAVIREDSTNFLKDWMVKAGITHIITDSTKMLKHIKSDPMLGSNKRSIYKIRDLNELHEVVQSIINSTRTQSKLEPIGLQASLPA